MNALQIAATGMSAQQMKVDVISNNLANMSTTGYNARRADFADLMYQQLQLPGAISASDGTILPTGVQVGLGVRPATVSVVLEQGSLAQTGGDLDVAIQGRGYLEVTMPDGSSAYTRDGALQRVRRWRDRHRRRLRGRARHHHSRRRAKPVDHLHRRGLCLFPG